MRSFLAIRLATFFTFLAGAAIASRSVTSILSRWDARWYARIAEYGYGNVVHASGGRTLHDYAFFPLFPLLERIVHTLTKLSYPLSGLLISVSASFIAVAAMQTIGARFYPQYSRQLIIIWSLLPISAVLWLSYSESLFTACATWALYFALKERWLLAGSVALLAGLTRPIGAALAIALAVHAILAVRSTRSWHPLVAAVLAPLGALTYLFYVQLHSHSQTLLAYLHFQSSWGNGFDGGQALFSFAINGSATGFFVLLMIALLLALTLKLAKMDLPILLRVYGVAVVLMTLSTAGYFSSKPRYLLPAFILLAPIARFASNQSTRAQRIAFYLALALSCVGSTFFLLGSTAP